MARSRFVPLRRSLTALEKILIAAYCCELKESIGGAVAAMGAKLGAPVTIATAPGAPEAKLKKIRDFGAKIVEVSAENGGASCSNTRSMDWTPPMLARG
ncbi:MAG: hypothetical protein R3C60_11625 [Parvularculaceae bacterium]